MACETAISPMSVYDCLIAIVHFELVRDYKLPQFIYLILNFSFFFLVFDVYYCIFSQEELRLN